MLPSPLVDKTLKNECWKSQKLSVKIIEAKHLDWDKSDISCDSFCVARIDNNSDTEARTQTVFSSNSPFWSEDVQFENIQGFHELKLVVWNENKSKYGAPRPLGKIIFSKQFLQGGDDQWYMLQNADSEFPSLGQVRVRIKHFPPKKRRQVHGFSVRILTARNLYKKDPAYLPNPFAVFHLLPDPDAISTQQTRVQNRTVNPTFSETFFFTYNVNEGGNTVERSIHCSIWDQNALTENDTNGFLGQIIIPLDKIIRRQHCDRWYWLNPLSADSANMYIERKARMRKKSLTEEEKRNRPRDLIKSIYKSEAVSPQTRKLHQFSEVGMAFSTCAFCNNVMIGTHLQCTNCNIICHQKCKDQVLPICGGVGAIRLRLKLIDTIVMPLCHYSDLLNLIQENAYSIPVILGKVSQDREDAARSLIRIFETNDTALRFLKAAVAHEISLAPDSRTLFRANSMASKAVDVFMKHVGLDYLKAVLGGPVLEIVQSVKSGELDPLRIEKSDKPEKILQRNIEVLMHFNKIIVDGIMKSADLMPTLLKGFFWFLQETVAKKFEKESVVRYTCISGFIFLRFFAPAVLGPKLFGLDVGTIDARSARNLMLVAKTLQNLSNLVEFGQKESYMAPMNEFIKNHMADMKEFIEAISRKPLLREKTKSHCVLADLPTFHDILANNAKQSALIARECAELQEIFSNSLDKMIAIEPANKSLSALGETLAQLDQKVLQHVLKLNENELDAVPWQSDDEADNQNGSEQEDGAKEILQTDLVKESEDERKIMRMLRRCSSTSMQSLMGSYRHSVDIRESIVKGNIKCDPLPLSLISTTNKNETLPSTGSSTFAVPHDKQLLRMSSRGTQSSFGISASSFSRTLDIIENTEEAQLAANSKMAEKKPNCGRANELRMSRAASEVSLAVSDKSGSGKVGRDSLTSRVTNSLGYFNKLLFDGKSTIVGDSSTSSSDLLSSSGRGSITSFMRRNKAEDSKEISSVSVEPNSQPHNLSSSFTNPVTLSHDRIEAEPWPLSKACNDHTQSKDSKNSRASTEEKAKITKNDVQDITCIAPCNISLLEIPPSENSAKVSLPSAEKTDQPQLLCKCVLNKNVTEKVDLQTPTDGGVLEQSSSRKISMPRHTRRRTVGSNSSDNMICATCGLNRTSTDTTINRGRSLTTVTSNLTAFVNGITGKALPISTASGSKSLINSTGTVYQTPEFSFSKLKFLQKSRNGQEPCQETGSDTSIPTFFAESGSQDFPNVQSSASTSKNTLTLGNESTKQSRNRSSTLTRKSQPSPPLHPANQESTCQRCFLKINDAMLEAGEKRYHPECLSCAICKISLTTSLIPFNNDVICRECYLRKSGLVCGACHQLIYNEYLVINGINFHVTCRRCDKCDAALSGRDHFILGDQVFCSDHRDSIITCYACSQHIEGEVLIAGNPQKFFHLNHFNCRGCGKDLSATVFYEMSDQLWCQPCFLNQDDKMTPVSSVEKLIPETSE
ncbi:hypothetical protein QVD99_001232 [Batrachochytrium dendrobatidis]|nr:hypothetical protein O5D80_000972 [Batrachochytrium dendrobatidis]KAK5672471.1 hypothetical protein QVD99_001232 [Batrachochytrium dendrobatidis]